MSPRGSKPTIERNPAPQKRAAHCSFYTLSVVAIVCAGFLAAPVMGAYWLRTSQIGYLPDDPKVALLSSDEPLTGVFHVGEYSADIGPDCGAWGPFVHNYRLDFTTLRTPGRYTVRFNQAESLPFSIGTDAYRDVPGKLIEFMRLQRCGDNPVTGEQCHQQDAIDAESGRTLDLTGGWHDAGDRIKHMITTSYCVAALHLAGAVDEAGHGAALLIKIHPDADTVYVQIADDRDHAPPDRLWHDDESDYGWGPGGPRTAWPALGRPQGPKYQNESTGVSNLAGRSAAALALLGQIEPAESLYRLARARLGTAMSVPVKAPYYYGERSFYDDLQWAATELYIATRKPEYLQQALEYADRAGDSEWIGWREGTRPVVPTTPAARPTVPATTQPATTTQAGTTTRPAGPARHGHYECFPYVNLAHWRLYPHVDAAAQARLAGYYRAALERVRVLAEENPYRLGTPLVWCSTNNVIAVATQAVLYERMTGDRQFRPLAAECRDWIFGRNPWGVSLVIGVPADGDASSRPHHLFWKLKRHLPVGGLVDGPVYKDINDSLKFAPFGEDRLARFQSEAGVFHDVFEDFSTNEPIIDGTVALLLLIANWELPAAE